ncbi:MAG: ATP-dependent DNA ligase [Actinomycetota bacterium]
MGGVLLDRLVATSIAVAATSKRGEKTAALAELLRGLDVVEIEPAVGFLSGEARQGRIGVGWRTVSGVEADPAAEASLSIGELDAALTRLQATTGAGSAGARAEQLAELFGRATADEAEFIGRLLVGELRQGALAGIVADAVAKAAGVPAARVRRAAMLGGDLGRAARIALTEGVDGLAAVRLRVLHGVQPMLASTAEDLAAAVADLGLVSVEWKLDGARVQVHRQGDDVRVFTRNLNDVTGRLPEVVEVARSLPVDSVVLDGETLSLGEDGRPAAFQDTMSRFGREDEADWEAELRPWFFDVLHVDGRDVLDEPLTDRLGLLEGLAAAHRVPGRVTADPDEAAEVLDEALSLGHEGVMVKGASSTYEAGRRGKAWRKIKPAHTLDLVVLAAEWGHGRRTGWLSNLHLGARGADGAYVMVGKTFKGMTDEVLAWQTERLQELAVAREGITVHVRPELVVEIAVDGVQSSTRYAGGAALRFARVKGYRPDKDPADADTIETVLGLLPGRP